MTVYESESSVMIFSYVFSFEKPKANTVYVCCDILVFNNRLPQRIEKCVRGPHSCSDLIFVFQILLFFKDIT